jgi:hypothetical protein
VYSNTIKTKTRSVPAFCSFSSATSIYRVVSGLFPLRSHSLSGLPVVCYGPFYSGWLTFFPVHIFSSTVTT